MVLEVFKNNCNTLCTQYILLINTQTRNRENGKKNIFLKQIDKQKIS